MPISDLSYLSDRAQRRKGKLWTLQGRLTLAPVRFDSAFVLPLHLLRSSVRQGDRSLIRLPPLTFLSPLIPRATLPLSHCILLSANPTSNLGVGPAVRHVEDIKLRRDCNRLPGWNGSITSIGSNPSGPVEMCLLVREDSSGGDRFSTALDPPARDFRGCSNCFAAVGTILCKGHPLIPWG